MYFERAAMKRAIIFAHYDKDSIIDDYVIFYCKELKKFTGKLIFVSCNDLSKEETDKISSIADTVISGIHKEYDFGSFKRGFETIRKTEEWENLYDEIVFANDSCYAPLYPFETVFNKMDATECDFWGISKNRYYHNNIIPHIQSYFFAMRRNVFTSDEFINFMENIQEEPDKDKVIYKYELGLSVMLYKKGYKDAVFLNPYENIANITIKKWKNIILKYNMPFLKCTIPRLKNYNVTTADGWQEVVKTTDYPVELIEKNLLRTKEPVNKELNLPVKIKEFVYDFLNYIPHKFRLKFICVLRKICSMSLQK